MSKKLEFEQTISLYNDKPSCVSHLECSITGKDDYEAGKIHGLSEAGRPLLVRYDLDTLKNSVTREEIEARPGGFWKYREFLPVENGENVISLGEVMTPLIPLKHSVPDGCDIIVKDEGRLPTGSFKARGLGVAAAMSKELGQTHLAIPTNGNAGAALAAYASFGGLKTTAFCPDDTPLVNIREIELQGADVFTVNGLVSDCIKIVLEGNDKVGWTDYTTLKEPYRIEGKKTMGLELAEQFGWELPDVIFYPTGGGTGFIGMWKAFDELEKIGWIGSKRPKMVAVQAANCAPIVKAYEDGVEHATFWENAHTEAWGIRVPAAIGDFLMIRTIHESGGFAIAVDEEDIFKCRDKIARKDGLLLCPEGAATFAAWQTALKNGHVNSSDKVLLFNTATGLKYPMPETNQSLNKNLPIDYSRFK